MIKKGLGKGLNALLSIYDEEEEQDENVSREQNQLQMELRGLIFRLFMQIQTNQEKRLMKLL